MAACQPTVVQFHYVLLISSLLIIWTKQNINWYRKFNYYLILTKFTAIVISVNKIKMLTISKQQYDLDQGSANCGPRRVNLRPASTLFFWMECGPRKKTLWPAEQKYISSKIFSVVRFNLFSLVLSLCITFKNN